MYYMKRRKPRYDPRLLSFTFEVMADQIEQIREENASEADAPQITGQSPENFLADHLAVGTIPSPVAVELPPVEPENVPPVAEGQTEPWPFYQSIPTAITLTHLRDGRISISGSGINSGPIRAVLEQIPGGDGSRRRWWTFPGDREREVRDRLSWALTPIIERGPDGLVGDDGKAFAPDVLANIILPAMTKQELARLFLPDALEGAAKESLIQGLVYEARENEKVRRTPLQTSATVQIPEDTEQEIRPYGPEQLLAELKTQKDQVEQDALRQGRMPIFDARLLDRIAILEREVQEDRAKDPDEVLGRSEFAQRAHDQYAGWKKPEQPQHEVLRFIKEGEPDNRYRYHTNESNGGRQLVRTLLNPHVGSLTSVLHDDGQWHTTSGAPRGAKPFTFKDIGEAFWLIRLERTLPREWREF